MAGYAAVAAHFQRPQRSEVAELLAAGESDRVEFKSTARVNLHTGQKDDRMEQVIAKTVCASLNADGGTLLVGVDDLGTPLGLEPDLATMKSPDLDRYELWMRDLFVARLGSGDALASIQKGKIGQNVVLDGPFGPKKMIYADYVASGRALRVIEDVILEDILPYYANRPIDVVVGEPVKPLATQSDRARATTQQAIGLMHDRTLPKQSRHLKSV